MKLGVCVPYRNREAHLKEFVPRVGKYLEDRGIDYQMYFGHQKDDLLFNRGAMKNIAAKAAFADGCDYIVWHDIDMIPVEGGGADYSFPEEHPIHIATNISQMDYKLKYFEYFGGAVVFSKEQVEKTNGYSNEYWDWGSEDDDLFWRCYLEGMADVRCCGYNVGQEYLHFSGQDSYIKVPVEDTDLKNFMGMSHTIQITCRAFQQPDKVQMYLVGDPNRKYVEFPILCVPGYDYGINFNNSKALDVQFWNSFNQHNYMWCKKYDQQWSTITVTLDAYAQEARLYLNGREVDASLGQGSKSPIKWLGRLKRYGSQAIYIGSTPSVSREDPRKFFKGDVREVKIWKRCLSPEEVQESFNNFTVDDDPLFTLTANACSHPIQNFDVETRQEDIILIDSVLPWRKQGRFECLPHPDEGIVAGRFVKGKPSADNERRYQTRMQQGQVDYKSDGIAQTKYKLLNIEEIAPKAYMVNVSLDV